VAGAGPAGTATALLLARFGVEVKLVEREASFERTFRGEGLMPLGIDALFEMGLGGVLETVPGRAVESWDIWIDCEEVFVVPEPVEELGERAMRVVSQPCLLEKMVEEDWLSKAVRSAPSWLAEHIVSHEDEIEGPTRLNVLVGRAPRWTAPGVLLLGDASHPMSPVRAQGINLALRDAVVAANHLVPVLRGGGGASALDAACRAAQAEREPEIVNAQRLQRREAAGQGDARSGSWRFGLTRRLARRMGRYRWAQAAWLRRQHDLRFGSTEVKLRISPLA